MAWPDDAERLAGDPATASDELSALSLHPDASVRRAVAANPSTPPPVLGALIVEFREVVLSNAVWPLLLLEDPSFFRRLPDATLAALARSPSCPEGVVAWALQPPRKAWTAPLIVNAAVAIAVRQRIFCSLVLERTSRWDIQEPSVEQVRDALGEEFVSLLERGGFGWWGMSRQPCDPALDAGALGALSRVGRLGAALALSHPNAPAALLASAAASSSPLARRWAGENPRCPPGSLSILATDADVAVRRAVASNASSSPEVLVSLAASADGATRDRLAANPATPPEVLMQLARDADLARAMAAGEHPRATAAVVRALLEHRGVGEFQWLQLAEREAAGEVLAAHPQATPPLLFALASSRCPTVRCLVATHPNLDSTTSSRLLGDAEPDVLKALVGNPAVPAERRALAWERAVGR
jgi:hypothetical protein